jgi:hypothetical protein
MKQAQPIDPRGEYFPIVYASELVNGKRYSMLSYSPNKGWHRQYAYADLFSERCIGKNWPGFRTSKKTSEFAPIATNRIVLEIKGCWFEVVIDGAFSPNQSIN